MYLLERKMNEYQIYNIVIGIFDTEEKAQSARQEYLECCNEEDVWEEQSLEKHYGEPLEKSVLVVDVADLFFDDRIDSEKVYVVNRVSEMFGQMDRKIHAIYSDKKEAISFVDKIDKLENDLSYEEWAKNDLYDNFDYSEMEIVRLNNIYLESIHYSLNNEFRDDLKHIFDKR